MHSPKISVIMGIYNCALTLQEALDSLYAQTYQDFEIILCDDGSKDDTYKIASKNAKEHSNIVLLQNSYNLGLNQTLNNCLSVASGEYIARMDGDDFSMPERFEKEVHFLDEHPEYAIVSTPMIYFDQDGEFGRGRCIQIPTKDILNYGVPFCHAPCMIRRIAYEEVGYYTTDKRLLRFEDYNLWMKMFKAGFFGYNLDEHLYAMRDDRNAAKRRNFKTSINGIYAHYLAYRELDLSLFLLLNYSIKKVIKGIMPINLYIWFHKHRFSK